MIKKGEPICAAHDENPNPCRGRQSGPLRRGLGWKIGKFMDSSLDFLSVCFFFLAAIHSFFKRDDSHAFGGTNDTREVAVST